LKQSKFPVTADKQVMKILMKKETLKSFITGPSDN